jgi:purine-nucleoside phosphorylase
MMATVKETKDFLEAKLAGFKPDVALIVGSGLGGIASGIAKPTVISYTDVPHFPKPTVAGHAGQMIFGEMAGKKLMVLSGRFHYYEGRTLAEIVYPVHVIDALNVKVLIVTNAAGGVNPQYNPGDLMIIEDHINLMGTNPLLGMADNGAVKFLDMSQAYSARLREKLDNAAEKLQLMVRRGVYVATTGPNYETPAEVKAFAWLGADAVGMSTVPEVIIARYHNIEVAGISCIANLAAGITNKKLSHDEVLAISSATQDKLGKLLTEFINML